MLDCLNPLLSPPRIRTDLHLDRLLQRVQTRLNGLSMLDTAKSADYEREWCPLVDDATCATSVRVLVMAFCFVVSPKPIDQVSIDLSISLQGWSSSLVLIPATLIAPRSLIAYIMNHHSTITENITVLIVASDPWDLDRLQSPNEQRTIKQVLNATEFRDNITVEPIQAAQPEDITEALHKYRPNILHFSGHGQSDGSICFRDQFGTAKAVYPTALGDIFKLAGDYLWVVILNCCYAAKQADAMLKSISYLIAMDTPIKDNSAVSFSHGFYKALGSGKSFSEAFKWANGEVAIKGLENLNARIYEGGNKSGLQFKGECN